MSTPTSTTPVPVPTGDLERPDKHPNIDLIPTIVVSQDHSHYTDNYGEYWGPKLEAAHIAVDTKTVELSDAETVLAELHQQANLALKTGDLGPPPPEETPVAATASVHKSKASTPTSAPTVSSAKVEPEPELQSESRSSLFRRPK